MRTPENISETVRITVQMVGKADQTFVFSKEPTVKEVLNTAWVPETAEVRCAWELAKLSYELEDGDILTVMGKTITQG